MVRVTSLPVPNVRRSVQYFGINYNVSCSFIFLKQYITYIYQTKRWSRWASRPPSRGTESLAADHRERGESLPPLLPTCPPARPTESALHRYRVRGSVVVFNRYHLLDWDYLLFHGLLKAFIRKGCWDFFKSFRNRFTYSPRFSMLMWQIMLIGFWS